MRWFAPMLLLLLACGGQEQPSPLPLTASVLAVPVNVTEEAPIEPLPAPPLVVEMSPPPPPPKKHAGEATYYRPSTHGMCRIDTPSDNLVAAMGSSLYSKAHCGQCAEVTGPKGSVVVLLNDKCEACKGDSLDLSTAAFTQIADKTDGRVRISWHFTDCP